MRQSRRKEPYSLVLPIFLLVAVALVHCIGWASQGLSQSKKDKPASTKKQQVPSVPQVQYGVEKLPVPVQEMREAMLSAVRSGRIEELRHAYEMNELKPDLSADLATDPVAHWKQISSDGRGLEILAALGQVLDAGYVALPLGQDVENNKIYVWPYFAEVSLGKLTPAQEVELLRLVPSSLARDMRATGHYSYWRVAIGADGVWHSFRKSP